MKKIIFKRSVTKGYNINGIYIEKGCFVEKGATIWSNNIILNNIMIFSGATILPFNHIDNSEVHNGSVVGPFCRLRQNSKIYDGCKVGNFVEIKNSTIGNKSIISHLTYVGDGEVGSCCNIGCGVVFCNYDGQNKHKTILKDNVFVGCNSNLVAPITIEKNSYIAASSTITENVPEHSFVIGRSKAQIKENYKNKYVDKDK